MEEKISKMSKNLGTFCHNIQSTSDALKQSLERRPIPLDSASTTFIQSLNSKVSSLSCDLNLLESMSMGTVSFEELLGHCHQLYKVNQSHFSLVRQRLNSSDDGFDEFEEDFMAQSISTTEPQSLNCYQGSSVKGFEDNSLFDESLSLQSLGLSEVCLASLASEGDGKIDVLDSPPKLSSMKVEHQDEPKCYSSVSGKEGDETKLCDESKLIIVSEDEYENMPSYMKTLAQWQDLQSAVEKMNSFLRKKGNSTQSNFFHPDELESMGLGPKGRSYLLLLVRMKRLGVETNNGLISYRVL